MHRVLTFLEQPNKTSIGRTLSVDDKVFEDLDELIIGYALSLRDPALSSLYHDLASRPLLPGPPWLAPSPISPCVT
ncbi:MAG: hypothetical protein ACPIOQ_77620, partial [Promethearchaeia archaeon]